MTQMTLECGSESMRERASCVRVPGNGSPPSPKTIDWPRPSEVVWAASSYEIVPDLDASPKLSVWDGR